MQDTTLTEYSGLLRCLETTLAVRVFPTPSFPLI
jgi:hypothetical protein